MPSPPPRAVSPSWLKPSLGWLPRAARYRRRDQRSHHVCLLQVEDKAKPRLLLFNDVCPVQRHILRAGGFGAGGGGGMGVPVSSLWLVPSLREGKEHVQLCDTAERERVLTR